MKFFDCFMYDDENLILDIRLNTLNDQIDKFVIIEAKLDHQGNKKKLNFQIESFKKFKDKIIYKVIDSFPKNQTNWERENFQRNFILKGLSSALEDDYIIISDLDEIPNLSNLKNIQNYKYTVFEQKMFYYKINLLNRTHPVWFGSKMCKKKYLKSPQWLRNQKVKKNPFWKFYKIKWNLVKDGGWHFSFLMTPQRIQQKIKSFAHAEFNKSNFTSLDKITSSIEKGIDIFDRNMNYQKIDLDKSFPSYILNNKKKFVDWIL
jgi:beta-1,4-mannosyl-glycoprotein beta-1,4-N-acetylglucosaminyltransferase